MDINGPGKSREMHIKRSWKVMENHLQCSVCTVSTGNSQVCDKVPIILPLSQDRLLCRDVL